MGVLKGEGLSPKSDEPSFKSALEYMEHQICALEEKLTVIETKVVTISGMELSPVPAVDDGKTRNGIPDVIARGAKRIDQSNYRAQQIIDMLIKLVG